MINLPERRKLYGCLRWAVSIMFFFLAMSKLSMMGKTGIKPYQVFVELAQLPESFKYYGVVAVLIEVILAIALWVKKFYSIAILLTMGLSFLGIALGIYSLIFKLNSDCGCGLLGDNEYGLLLQKLVIIFILGVLYKKKHHFFPEINDNTQV